MFSPLSRPLNQALLSLGLKLFAYDMLLVDVDVCCFNLFAVIFGVLVNDIQCVNWDMKPTVAYL